MLIRFYKGKVRVLFNIEKTSDIIPESSEFRQDSRDKYVSEVTFTLTTICMDKVNGSRSVFIKLVI